MDSAGELPVRPMASCQAGKSLTEMEVFSMGAMGKSDKKKGIYSLTWPSFAAGYSTFLMFFEDA